MKLWSRKGFIAMLSVFTLVSLTIGCSKSVDNPTASGNSPTNASATPAPTKTGPKYPAAMSYWVGMDSDVAFSLKNFNEMGLYKQLQKITGTQVDFKHPPAGDKDQFNLMMASGKLPDVVYYPWKSNSPDKAIKDGRILRLNEIIEKYAPNLSKILKERPELKKQLTSDGDNIYVFPSFEENPSPLASHGLFLRKDWLDKLNLKPPVTIDDWEKVLTAFRDGDPNGNGKKDEIPFSYNQADIETSFAFVGAFNITTWFYQDRGFVKYGPAEPAFKDYLTLMNKWYKEGLIDKDYLTSNSKIRDSKIQDDTLGSMAGWAASNLGASTQLKKQKDPNTSFKLIGVPFPTLKAGNIPIITGPAIPNWAGSGAAISASAKNPEEIAAWLDYGYSKEGSIMFNFGVEGESYTMVNGKPRYTDLILKNPNKLSVTQAVSIYSLANTSGPYPLNADAVLQLRTDPETKDAMVTWAQGDHSTYMPVNTNSEEQPKIATIMTDLSTYKNEMINKFIMGIEPLTKFDEYISTLKKLKLDEVIKLYQAQYDRYLKK